MFQNIFKAVAFRDEKDLLGSLRSEKSTHRSMRHSIFSALVLMMSPLSLHAEEPALAVRVMSFNLRYINPGDQGERTWLARRDQASQVIREDKADVIGLQEAFRSMLDDISVRVPGYQEIGVGREDGKTVGEYAAILVKKDRFNVLDSGTFWLSDTPSVPNSMTWKNRVTRVCSWAKLEDRATKRMLCFFNTHLDHESQEAREKGVAMILEHIAALPPETPVIITGDFNAAEDNPAISNIKISPRRMVDTWRELNLTVPMNESGTMSMFTGVRDTAKIDYIFVPAGTRIVDSEIIRRNRDGVYPSDHYPVRASVEFR
jgi:endonuclease/exonuclease/phosphatase family metal-dependent hydrolase